MKKIEKVKVVEQHSVH